MRKHSQSFKENIKEMGRELDSIITYTLNGENIELGNSELNSVTPVVESSLLKSVMKELDIDSNVDIPLGTIINYKFGLAFNGSDYEYIDFGNYIVFSSEKQEDTNSYNIVCYDRMLASMVEYEKLQTTIKSFSMTVRDYIGCVCVDLGLYFKNKDEEFANYDKIIESDLYEGLGYTYRDILDELAQVTASNIVINNNDEVEIRYIEDTCDIADITVNSNIVEFESDAIGYHKITFQDPLIDKIDMRYPTDYETIDEEYLKDVNVAFGEKYGPVNSIVLSRAADSDKIYLRDEESVEANGVCEINISENQIMNFNNRDEFLPDILERLNGLEYYTNDFSSTGVCYYEVGDMYRVKVGDETYQCVLFNDQINIEQGLEETIYTELPEQAETDYTKADKTDRRINRTTLVVDKQNQTITGVVEKVDGQDKKITEMQQTVDGFTLKVESQISSLEQSVEYFRVDLENNVIVIPVSSDNTPLKTQNFDINYSVYYKGNKITLKPTTDKVYVGINTSIQDSYIRFSVNASTAIPNLDNKYTFTFTYNDGTKSYTINKVIMVSLAIQGKDGAKGDKGDQGPAGKDGDENLYQGDTAPDDKTLIWLDIANNQLKRWNGDEWEVINDFGDDFSSIMDTINGLNDSIQEQLSDINSTITEIRETYSTSFEQTDQYFNFQFDRLTEKITQLEDTVHTEQTETIKYIKFENGVIYIGTSDSPFKMQISNDEISIMYGNDKASWWKQDTLYVKRLMLGNFAFTPRENGSLDFGKVES